MKHHAILTIAFTQQDKAVLKKTRAGTEINIETNGEKGTIWVPAYILSYDNIEELRAKIHRDVDDTINYYKTDNNIND